MRYLTERELERMRETQASSMMGMVTLVGGGYSPSAEQVCGMEEVPPSAQPAGLEGTRVDLRLRLPYGSEPDPAAVVRVQRGASTVDYAIVGIVRGPTGVVVECVRAEG